MMVVLQNYKVLLISTGKASNCTVTLTVKNAAGKNNVRKTNYIIVK